MSELYIQIEDNAPLNHPAYAPNLVEAFGEIPSNWEPFIRADPVIGVYQVLDSTIPVYEKVSGVYTDVWQVREMTAPEVLLKDAAIASDLLEAEIQPTSPDDGG